VAVLAVLVNGGSPGAALGQGPGKLPAALPPELVAAWKKAGADVGWMRVNESGILRFLSDKAGKAGDVPAFRFSSWKKGVLGDGRVGGRSSLIFPRIETRRGHSGQRSGRTREAGLQNNKD
jgi:hypothetical protein